MVRKLKQTIWKFKKKTEQMYCISYQTLEAEYKSQVSHLLLKQVIFKNILKCIKISCISIAQNIEKLLFLSNFYFIQFYSILHVYLSYCQWEVLNVLPDKCYQDPLEEHFGKQGCKRRWYWKSLIGTICTT